MNYSRIYEQLIDKRLQEAPPGYSEVHHIIPKCKGGTDEPENLVHLTPEEHYLVHQLLVKIHPDDHQLAHAAHMMSCGRSSNKLYGWLRRRHSEAMSNIAKARIGSKNGAYGTMWICNTELQENKKITKSESIPDGWIKGRNKWKIKSPKKYPQKQCPQCKKHFKGQGRHCSKSCGQRSRTIPLEVREKISQTLSGNPRPYRVGLKYQKRKSTECSTVW